MYSFHGRWHCRTTSNKEPCTVDGLSHIHVTKDVRSGLHGTHVHTNADKSLQMLCDVSGAACGSIHSCCLSTVSTCLAIHERHLGLFQEWLLDYCPSTSLNSHYLQHTQPTPQVMRDSCQWKLCISGHKVICTFILHFQSGITLWSLSADLKKKTHSLHQMKEKSLENLKIAKTEHIGF